MSVIVMPSDLFPTGCTIGQWLGGNFAEVSETTGAQAERLLGPPRWQMSLRSAEALSLAEASKWETLQLMLRGGINHLAAYDVVRQVPEGTLRGTVTLGANAVAGANTAALTGCPTSSTVLPGDWLQIGSGVGSSQLVKVVELAQASGGSMTVVFEPPMRKTIASGSPVITQKAVCYYKQMGTLGSSYKPNRKQGGFAIDLIEVW